MNKEKLLGFFALFLLITPFTFIIVEYWNMSSLNSWGASEWLISYSGGFVRRGLGGEIIYNISSYFLISPSKIIVLFSFLSYLLLCIILIKVSKNIIPIYVLLSPLILGMPIYSNFLIRKDVFGVLCLLLTLILIKEKLNIKTIFLTNFLCIVAILNHEAFLFYGLPMIIFTINLLQKRKVFSTLGPAKMSATILISFIVIFFHGTPEISNDILNAWNLLIYEKFADCCYLHKDYAINAIGHSIYGPMSLTKNVLMGVHGLFTPLAWLLTWAISIFIIGQLGISKFSIRENFYFITISQTIIIFPLFIVGWDFGRWMFYIFLSSISWIFIFQDNYIKLSLKNFIFIKKRNLLLRKKYFYFIILLFTSIPSCCWNFKSYLKATPFFSNINVISYVVTGHDLKGQYKFLEKRIKFIF